MYAGAPRSLESLPPPPDVSGASDLIAAYATRNRTKIVVVDDDPTGTQCVSDVPVITRGEEGHIRWLLQQPGRCGFIETDSRSMTEDAAVALNLAIGQRLAAVAIELDVDVRCISRSDSTLRGHFPAEPVALDRGLRAGGLERSTATVICPAFVPAGRITVDGVHYVRTGAELIPVGETEFARDATFGYSNSDLRHWVVERAGGLLTVADVDTISIADLRVAGTDCVVERLSRGGYVVVDAVTEADLHLFVLGLLAAEDSGSRVMLRSGPSLVAARAAVGPKTVVPDLVDNGAPGLLVVGSHTELTTRQLRRATERHRLAVVELDVSALMKPDSRAKTLSRAAEAGGRALRTGRDVALVTSRQLLRGRDPGDSLRLSRSVADAVAEVVEVLDGSVQLGFVLAKGGITSSEVVRKGLRASRAQVAGQLFDGLVAVWIIDRAEGASLPFVVFPGNVGSEDGLANALDRLGRG